MYPYESRLIQSTLDFRISLSVTTKPIDFLLLELIDSVSFRYIRKIFLFLLYVQYEQRYYDIKLQCKKFHVETLLSSLAFNLYPHTYKCDVRFLF